MTELINRKDLSEIANISDGLLDELNVAIKEAYLKGSERVGVDITRRGLKTLHERINLMLLLRSKGYDAMVESSYPDQVSVVIHLNRKPKPFVKNIFDDNFINNKRYFVKVPHAESMNGGSQYYWKNSKNKLQATSCFYNDREIQHFSGDNYIFSGQEIKRFELLGCELLEVEK